MYDLSIVMPSIRPHLLEQIYNTATISCNRHNFELVVCGPYEPPQNLLALENVTWIQDWGSPVRCAQIACINAKGKYLYHTTDDVKFLPYTISNALDLANNDTIVCMKYTEWYDYQHTDMPLDYWVVYGLPDYKGDSFAQVNQDWGCFCQFIVDRELYLKYGGFDAYFEYLNHACHDFLFRVQRQGIKTVESQEYICNARWLQATQEDHGPIYHAQLFSDAPKFNKMWSEPNDRAVIDLYNWQDAESVWKRRFK